MAFGFDVNNYGDSSEYMYMLSVDDIIDAPHHDETLIAKPLPPGQWEIICTSKEADEDDAFEVIESMSVPTGGDDYVDYYKDYLKPDSPECWPWIEGDPMASLRSLLAANGCDLNKNWLIVKKIA
jgi:hypothetical protein